MPAEVLAELRRATHRLGDVLDGADLHAPSTLPGWTRLTVACHLRYGAVALRTMTEDALAGRATSYYPDGREAQRPRTLEPDEGETADDVVRSLREASAALSDLWEGLGADDWSADVVEPPGNPDLGTVPLVRLPLFRLTEVEVHGTDLGLGLPSWSDALVRHALPMRLDWLGERRTNHRRVDPSVRGSFLLRASDLGIVQRLEIDGPSVTSHRVRGGDATADRVIDGTGRELLALLLGRWHDGSAAAEAFRRAFPGP